jgi:hypothetical protein
MNPEASEQSPDNEPTPENTNPPEASVSGRSEHNSLQHATAPSLVDLLPPALIHEIHQTHAADFVRDGEALLRDVTHFVGMAGAWWDQFVVPTHRKSPFRERGSALHLRLKVLVNDGFALMDEISGLIKTPNQVQLSGVVTDKLYPFMSQLKGLIRTTTVLKREVAEKWLENPGLEPREHVVRDEHFHLAQRYLQVNTRIAQLRRGSPPIEESAPLGLGVLQALLFPPQSPYVHWEGLSHEFAFPEGDLAVKAAPEDLLYVLRCSYIQFRQAIREVNDDIGVSFANANRLGSVAPEDVRLSAEAAILEHLHLANHDPEVEILPDGKVKFSYSFIPVLKEAWKEKALVLKGRLDAAAAVCKAYGGSFSFTQYDEPPSVVLEVAFPSTQAAAQTYRASPYLINSLRRPYVTDDSPCLRGISMVRRVEVHTGEWREYKINFPAAAILSETAFKQLCRAFCQVDRLIKIFPRFQEVSLGVREAFQGVQMQSGFEEGRITGDFRQSTPASPEHDLRRHLLAQLEEPFEWEVTRKEWERKIQRSLASRENPEAELSSRHLSLGPGLIFDEDLIKALSGLSAKATFVQLSLEHPDIHEPEVLPRYTTLVKSMLLQVDEMIQQVRLSLKLNELKVQIGCFVRMRVSDAGKSDALFFVEVFDGKNREVCRGAFHSGDSRLRYKIHDSNMVSGLLRRMGSFVDILRGNSKRSFRELDRALSEAGLELPEEVIDELREAIPQGASREEVDALLESFLRQPHTSVQEADGKVTISVDMGEPQVQGQAYGVITQVNGEHPEEVCDFGMARKLYEEGNHFFTPTERFLREYRLEE